MTFTVLIYNKSGAPDDIQISTFPAPINLIRDNSNLKFGNKAAFL